MTSTQLSHTILERSNKREHAIFEEDLCVFVKLYYLLPGWGRECCRPAECFPKEMLPLVDKPTLQYIVEEAVAAGVEEIIFVTSRSKRSIEDHFDVFPELEEVLERKGKLKE